ncbi:MAG: arylesterase [Bdellovibrionales bacterium]|nr:arylesterase [Bdellovibrionales bacterium]
MNKSVIAGILLFYVLIFPLSAYADTGKKVLFLGDSLAAGFGLSEEQSYPALVEQFAQDAGYSIVCINAGVSGDTTAGGLRRLDWLLRQRVDVLVVALGGNDALRGVDPSETRKNLTMIIRKYRDAAPDGKVLLAGMKAPVNMGQSYTEAFSKVYPEVARETKVELMPFLLAGVAAVPELNQADRIHPNAAGQRKIAENVWPILKKILGN